MKRIISLFVLVSFALGMSAMPAKRTPFTHTLPDGQQITLQLVGDETMHYFINTATQEKMLQDDNGNFYVVSEAQMKQMLQRADVRRKSMSSARAERLNARRATTAAATHGHRAVGTFGSMIGSKKGLVILVNYADKAIASSHTQAVFDNQFNKEGYNSNGHIGSLHDYFYDQSYGQFDLTFDVVGPVTLSHNMSYYGGNDSSGNDKHPAEMVIEALNAIDDEVNFADYDWDGDGEVDQVYVIYAGYGENSGASSNTIWPHEWELSSAGYYGDGTGAQTFDGVTIDTYACSCELSGTYGSSLNGIGTACHEFSHCLGYPDFYDIDYSGGLGMKAFDVMDAGSYNGPNNNGEVPCGYTAYERWMAGWIEPVELSGPATITDMQPLNDTGDAYVIYNANHRDEYFLVENRQSRGWFKYYNYGTAGHGMFVTHVDYDANVWYNDRPNDTPSRQRMSWIAADKTKGSSPSGDFFPGTSNVRELTNTSHTQAGAKLFNKNTDGTYNMNHELTEIKEVGEKISFLFDGGELVDDGTRYTVTYNAGTGSCETTSWQQTDFMESTTLPEATAPSADWVFIGWSNADCAEKTTVKPSGLILPGTVYTPEENVTFHAVYMLVEEGTGEAGSYTLDYNAEPGLSQATLNYGYPVTYTAQDGSTWVVKTYKNKGMQLNKEKDASIKVPDCPGFITKITASTTSTRALKFSSEDYDGQNNPTVIATSSVSKNAVFQMEGKEQRTGYIYSTTGVSVVTKIVVEFVDAERSTYYTYPDATEIATPTISFDSEQVEICIGDEAKEILATVEGSNGEVVYSSSDETVATVDAATGMVKPMGLGKTTITAKVLPVSGVSKSATASYELTVSMPALSDIAILTLPEKVEYTEGETFDPEGLTVEATYENGYTQIVTDYVLNPESGKVLDLDDTTVTVAYTEGEVTKEASFDITVNALPRYVVTFDAGTGTCDVESDAEAAYQGGVVLPSAVGINENWTFAGWATESIAETMTRPELFMAGETFVPMEDTTLYAVYTCNDFYTSQPNGVNDMAGIREISIDAFANCNIYNLNGQRVKTPVRGQMYIVNGVKCLAK